MMRARLFLVCLSPLFFAFICTEQHDPRPQWEKMRKESVDANKPRMILSENGQLPSSNPADANAAPLDPIDSKYNTLCASCHGADGKADGPGALALNPRPRNFHDKAWQAKVDDVHIAKVIKEGGTSVGLNASMAAWGAVINDEEIKGLVKKIRAYGK